MDVTAVVDQIANLQILNQFLLSLFLLIPMVLVARTVVAGTRYSPILIIVIFGLTMGYVLVASGVSTPGLPQFSLIDLVSRTTIVALTVSFFVGGQELRIKMGIAEAAAILGILLASYSIAAWIKPIIALPQIFFAMIISAGLGALLYRWRFGPTIRALLFAGIPVVLAANFMIGGSRINDAFAITGMNAVLAYGFFGKMFWMFGGIALLMFFGKTGHARNLAPGMAGALSHSGLTGACTAGDLGDSAAYRAPIMINVPFFGHIFVFSILAMSAREDSLMLWPSLLIVMAGIVLTLLSLRTMSGARANDAVEVKGLMQFSLGWQLCAVFGGFILLSLAGMPLGFTAMAVSSGISHFGLFAATQGGMFGPEASALIPFIFSMPFLIHPLVFFMFGRAMERDGTMPRAPVFVLAVIGLFGVLYSMFAV